MNCAVLIKASVLTLFISTLGPCVITSASATEQTLGKNQEDLNEQLHRIIVSTDDPITNRLCQHLEHKIENLLTPNDQKDKMQANDRDFSEFLICNKVGAEIKNRIDKVIDTAQKRIEPDLDENRTMVKSEKNFKLIGLLDNDDNREILNIRIAHQVNAIKALIQQGADVNLKDKIAGRTPMHWAVSCVQADLKIDFIKALFFCGGDVNAQDNGGETPMHFATYLSVDHVELLYLLGGNVNAKNEAGALPMQYVIDQQTRCYQSEIDFNSCCKFLSHYKIVKTLHNMGADLSSIDLSELNAAKTKRVIKQFKSMQTSKNPTARESIVIQNFFITPGVDLGDLSKQDFLKAFREDEFGTLHEYLNLSRYLTTAKQIVPSLKNISLNIVRENIKKKQITRRELSYLPQGIQDILYIPSDYPE